MIFTKQTIQKILRILIGPGYLILFFFSFDRWKNITTTLNKFKIDKVKILNLNKNLLTPYEGEDFIIVSEKIFGINTSTKHLFRPSSKKKDRLYKLQYKKTN